MGSLIGQTFGDGHSDSYAYTVLGMRLTKSDPTGGYSYLADAALEAVTGIAAGSTLRRLTHGGGGCE